jgi:hypothetical protein
MHERYVVGAPIDLGRHVTLRGTDCPKQCRAAEMATCDSAEPACTHRLTHEAPYVLAGRGPAFTSVGVGEVIELTEVEREDVAGN